MLEYQIREISNGFIVSRRYQHGPATEVSAPTLDEALRAVRTLDVEHRAALAQPAEGLPPA